MKKSVMWSWLAMIEILQIVHNPLLYFKLLGFIFRFILVNYGHEHNSVKLIALFIISHTGISVKKSILYRLRNFKYN